jgi:hypothetical protein
LIIDQKDDGRGRAASILLGMIEAQAQGRPMTIMFSVERRLCLENKRCDLKWPAESRRVAPNEEIPAGSDGLAAIGVRFRSRLLGFLEGVESGSDRGIVGVCREWRSKATSFCERRKQLFQQGDGLAGWLASRWRGGEPVPADERGAGCGRETPAI